MLEGLLGRSGFYSKCKSLIKQTRTRIDVVKRKRNATQKFLRKDVADLLANGLEPTAFGRAEGLISELILSSCYDFIDHVCEMILKHLPVLQNLRECPEDCREAVASLMFAAARFSDLPELRELRDLFQERYGSSLEYYVNQKLVENISLKPPTMEKKVQLMQEIATEFSIWWDGTGFQERMSIFSATEKVKRQSTVTLHEPENKVLTPLAEETVHTTVKDDPCPKKRSESSSRKKERDAVNRIKNEVGREIIHGKRDDTKHNVSRGLERVTEKYKPPSYREETIGKREEHEPVTEKFKPTSYGEETIRKREEHEISLRRREPRYEVCDSKENGALEADPLSIGRRKNPLTISPELAEDIQATSIKKRDDVPDSLKSNFRSAVPPPYVKPKKNRHKTDDLQDTLTFVPGSNCNRSEKIQGKSMDFREGLTAAGNVDDQVCFTEIYYKDTSCTDFTPRRKSHRRKHSRSASIKDEKVNDEVGQEEERVVRRVSTSRRRHESKKGLQILFDDDHYKKKDEEEKMIDKLLLHYSKKPSPSDPGKPRRKAHREMNGTSKSPHHQAIHVADTREEEETSTPTTSRSFSLPSCHVTEPVPQKKIFSRAISFQQDTPAKHVHPKLPDYDDLAATFAALRASKD